MTARYLTKSRFKLALECPTKLFYTGNGAYVDKSADNAFLAALAEGGYQVGALACAQFPEGMAVTDFDQQAQLERTRELLKQDTVTIFEAALEAQGYFVRVDILRKRGSSVELIEVKAKSFDPALDSDFRNNKGKLRGEWMPYLQDIAFQAHVAALAFPQFEYRSFLMLANKACTTSVDGLNQRFRIQRRGRSVAVHVDLGADANLLREPLLARVPVDGAVEEILRGTLKIAGRDRSFTEAARELAAAYRDERRLAPVPGAHCASCQFKAPARTSINQPRSGFHECWSEAFGWGPADFADGTILDVWNLRKKAELLAAGVLKPKAITLEDLGHDGEEPGMEGMTVRHRQWFQCHGGWPGGGDFYFDAAGMQAQMREWHFPLHFIDFETCAVAIPFGRGRRPYETIAFQFSHHVMQADGSVAHGTQFLEATPGVDPCIPFVRALRDALSGDSGTIFRWAAHENTVLNQLRSRLLGDAEPPPDRDDLVHFVESITTRKTEAGSATGHRNMIDLCKLAERHYFHPETRGSSSLKKVLPALMRSSAFLRSIYSQPVYGTAAIPSLNLSKPTSWWIEDADGVRDPYDLLPPVFDDFTEEEITSSSSSLPAELQEGGAAMMAYARLQFEAVDPRQRQAIEEALLRYCELDTLAMVMAVQAWQAWCHEAAARA